MPIKKYLKQIIVILFFIVLMPIMMSIFMEGVGFSKLIPVEHLGFQSAYVFFMITISAIIGGVLIGYLLAPLFLIIHKKFKGGRMIYGIQNRPEPEKFTGNFKPFFPALMAVNFGLMFNLNLGLKNMIMSESYLATPGSENYWPFIVFVMLLIITTGIAMALFSPVWFLLDAGIVYTNKEKVKDKSDPIELHSVGGWYMSFLKGYAGISVVISFYTFLVELITVIGADLHWSGFILFPLMPFFVLVLSLPAIVILDMTKKRRKKFILNFARKIGISDEYDIDIVKKS